MKISTKINIRKVFIMSIRQVTLLGLLLSSLLILLSCSNDDDSSRTALNRSPEAFNLIPIIGLADVNPTLAWQTTVDPDGDVIKYDVYLSEVGLDLMLVSEGLQTNSFFVNEALTLNYSTTYQWQVIAKDGNQGETSSNIVQFTTEAEEEDID